MKWNLNWQVIGLVLACMMMHGQVSAKKLFCSMQMDPYLGIEYQYEHIKGNGDWNDVLPANFQNGAIFIGNKYHPNFGIEVGYFHFLKKSQAQNTLSKFNGAEQPSDTSLLAQMKVKGFSVDWNIYVPLDPNFNVFALIGVVAMHPRVQIYSDNTTDLANGMKLVKGRNKTIMRMGVGAEYVESWWGARARLIWDQTQRMQLNVTDAQVQFGPIFPYAFKQSMVVTVGLFYRF